MRDIQGLDEREKMMTNLFEFFKDGLILPDSLFDFLFHSIERLGISGVHFLFGYHIRVGCDVSLFQAQDNLNVGNWKWLRCIGDPLDKSSKLVKFYENIKKICVRETSKRGDAGRDGTNLH